MARYLLNIFIGALILQLVGYFIAGCAQIGAPTGGPRDTLAPTLVKANPENKKTNFNYNKIVLDFNEYIELQDLSANLSISPLPKLNPLISSNLKTITIKLKDSLLPNTTYNIDFGNSIKDINEGNVYKSFAYQFSTGNSIDSSTIQGKVVMAETGKADSTLIVLLYKNLNDSAVKTQRPNYISKLDGSGNFKFSYLPNQNFNVYVLKDGDGNKFYNSPTEVFGFLNKIVNSTEIDSDITLFAYKEKNENNVIATTPQKKEKQLKYILNLNNGKQDLLIPLSLNFNNPIKTLHADSIFITDTNYHTIAAVSTQIDSSRKQILLDTKWLPETIYYLLINANAVKDSSGLALMKTDTIKFVTKSKDEYGSVKLNFSHLDTTKHPIMLLFEGDQMKYKIPLTTNSWFNKMMLPAELEIRILYDENNNGQWDPGNYSQKIQPEKVIAIPNKMTIKANWENENDIVL
jgi:hypothetical protein